MPLRWLVLAGLALVGCTTVGLHNPAALKRTDFGEPVTLGVCAYLDDGITPDEAASLLDDAWRGDGPTYGLVIRIVQTTRWERPAFAMPGIMRALTREPLAPPCDRIMAFVGRHVGDVLWSLLMPQVLGAVNDLTVTHGYVVARAVSVDQALVPPAHVLRHELHHMLGCEHGLTLGGCYERIAELKRAYEGSFFPAWSFVFGRVISSRGEINRLLGR
jgi:hypothetical protein